MIPDSLMSEVEDSELRKQLWTNIIEALFASSMRQSRNVLRQTAEEIYQISEDGAHYKPSPDARYDKDPSLTFGE